MSIIMGAMAGLGEGLQQTGKLYGDMALQDQAADLAVKKEKAILELKQQMEDAPLQRFGEAVKGKLSGTVEEPPLAPGEKFNDRRYEDRVENPRTRPVSRSEAMNSAANELLEKGDMKAYKAGKGIIGDKMMKIGEGDSLWDTETGKLVYQNMSKAERQALLEDRKDARFLEGEDRKDQRQQNMLAVMLSRIEKMGSGRDGGMAKAMMISIDRDILDLEKRIQGEEKIVRDIAAPKAEKDAAKERIASLTADKEFFRNQKYALMGDGKTPSLEDRAPRPDPKTSVVRTDNKPAESTTRPPLSNFMK